jgi:hypothetical protein
MVHLPGFYASCAIVGLLRGKFYCHPVLLNSANRYQKWWYGLRRLCARSELASRLEAKHRASDSPIHRSPLQRWATLPLYFACRRLLCSASRTSRDTPQSSIFWTIIPLIPTFPHSPGVALRAVLAGAGASPLVRPWQCMQAIWKETLWLDPRSEYFLDASVHLAG